MLMMYMNGYGCPGQPNQISCLQLSHQIFIFVGFIFAIITLAKIVKMKST
jgi:hypothetical protein